MCWVLVGLKGLGFKGFWFANREIVIPQAGVLIIIYVDPSYSSSEDIPTQGKEHPSTGRTQSHPAEAPVPRHITSTCKSEDLDRS